MSNALLYYFSASSNFPSCYLTLAILVYILTLLDLSSDLSSFKIGDNKGMENNN